MKFKILYTLFSAALFAFIFISSSGGRAEAAGSGNTGAPGDAAETCVTCHGTSAAIQIEQNIDVLDDMGNSIASTGYTPGEVYTVKVTNSVTQGTPSAYGFQLLCLNAPKDQDGPEVSNWSDPASNVKISFAANTNRTYAEHNQPSNTNEFLVKWEAPAEGSGIVTFYACGNGVNLSGSTAGDNADCSTLELEEATISSVNDLSIKGVEMNVFPNPVENDFQLGLQLEEAASFEMRIVDLNGKVVESRNLDLPEGEQVVPVDARRLVSGVYFVQLQNAEGVTTKKIIKK